MDCAEGRLGCPRCQSRHAAHRSGAGQFDSHSVSPTDSRLSITRPVYAPELYDNSNRVYSAGNPQPTVVPIPFHISGAVTTGVKKPKFIAPVNMTIRGAKAVLDSVADGVIPKDKAEDLVCVCGVFIHWEAEDNKKIFDYNYEAVKMAIKNAMTGSPKIDDALAKRNEKHPFAGF